MKVLQKEHIYFVKVVISALILGSILVGGASSFFTVGPNEQAVIIRLGKYYETKTSGLHFKLPFGIDQKIIVKTDLIHREEFGFRGEGNTQKVRVSKNLAHDLDLESMMLTGDLNVADVEWVVLYQITDPFKYLFKSSDPVGNIRDISESIMRRVIGDMLVSDVLTTGRVQIAVEAQKLMQEVVNRYDLGISIRGVKLLDVNPPELVKPSFNEVNAAKQEQEKMINQAEKEYNKIIPKAKGKAKEVISNAKGHALLLVNKAEGESRKFEEILKAYKTAPDITKKRIYLETMQKLFNRFEKITILDPDVKGVLPVFRGASLDFDENRNPSTKK